jgi:nucleotide-binding universal stress UspA family protein
MVEIKTILFPTDFSDYSNKAFPYAATLAKAFGARIILMHVAELEEEDPANPRHTFPAIDQYDGAIESERVIIRGHAPYKDILDVSRAKDCDLIVMATHGRSALSQFFLGGSVAEEVARFSQIPVFIVKIEPDEPPETYTGRLDKALFTTDFSDSADCALPLAITFAQQFNIELHVLHVIDDESTDYYSSKGFSRDDPDFRERVEALLRESVGSSGGAGAVSAYHVAEGRAENEIVRFAEAEGVDLIAISTRGHNALEDDILGTTTDRVIRHAPCPVLTVRI